MAMNVARVIILVVALIFTSSFFGYTESALRQHESRLGYALRWTIYRWLVLLCNFTIDFTFDLMLCRWAKNQWWRLGRDVRHYAHNGRWEVDKDAQESYLTKRTATKGGD